MELHFTRIMKINSPEVDMTHAVKELQTGGLVAFPTETVYGLGANAFNPEAVRKIFVAKGRPSDNPLIVHIANMEMLKPLVRELSPTAEKLAKAFWPGPLTLVLPKSDLVGPEVTAGLQTVAVRMPQHPIALRLIELAGVPVVAPSANLSGRPSPTIAQHVVEDLHGKLNVIIDGGPVGIGVESTVLDISGEVPMILRPGAITPDMIAQVLGRKVEIDPTVAGVHSETLASAEAAPKAPGMKYTHYAPKAPMTVFVGSEPDMVKAIQAKTQQLERDGLRVGVMATVDTAAQYINGVVFKVGNRQDLSTVAEKLYAVLRKFDSAGVDVILAEGFPEEGLGVAVMNRLMKAAGQSLIRV